MRRIAVFVFALFLLVCSATPAAASLPACTYNQPPEQVKSVCQHVFRYNQTVSIAPSVYYVWLRTNPASDSAFTHTIYNFNQPTFRVALATPRWDGRQWWWKIRASSRIQGWVEQAALVAGIVRPTPVAPQIITTQAAFQPFEKGYMLWTANDESIYVFSGASSSYRATWSYPIAHYRNNPDPVIETPPAGLFKPIRGFARVWQPPQGGLKDLLGWGTAQETAITATLTIRTEYDPFQSAPIVYAEQIALSNGLKFKIARGRGLFWSLVP